MGDAFVCVFICFLVLDDLFFLLQNFFFFLHKLDVGESMPYCYIVRVIIIFIIVM